jgi:BMFP domain-containing protein YqiC
MTDSSNRPGIDDLARRLAEAVPKNLRAMGEDLERNFKSLLQTGLEKMDLVTREEFDVQVAVLVRTREKLEALEARLAELQASPPT